MKFSYRGRLEGGVERIKAYGKRIRLTKVAEQAVEEAITT